MTAWDYIVGGWPIAVWVGLMAAYVWWEGLGGRARWQRWRR